MEKKLLICSAVNCCDISPCIHKELHQSNRHCEKLAKCPDSGIWSMCVHVIDGECFMEPEHHPCPTCGHIGTNKKVKINPTQRTEK